VRSKRCLTLPALLEMSGSALIRSYDQLRQLTASHFGVSSDGMQANGLGPVCESLEQALGLQHMDRALQIGC
jgi:hypothetical protein